MQSNAINFFIIWLQTALNSTKKLFSELLEAKRDEAVGIKRHKQSKKRNDYRNGYSYKTT